MADKHRLLDLQVTGVVLLYSMSCRTLAFSVFHKKRFSLIFIV